MSLFLNNRIDIVILSTEEKPTINLKNGSTLYEVDTAKLYVWYKGSWYDEEGNEVEETENTENTETNDSNRLIKSAETEEVKKVINKDVIKDDNK